MKKPKWRPKVMVAKSTWSMLSESTPTTLARQAVHAITMRGGGTMRHMRARRVPTTACCAPNWSASCASSTHLNIPDITTDRHFVIRPRYHHRSIGRQRERERETGAYCDSMLPMAVHWCCVLATPTCPDNTRLLVECRSQSVTDDGTCSTHNRRKMSVSNASVQLISTTYITKEQMNIHGVFLFVNENLLQAFERFADLYLPFWNFDISTHNIKK